MSRKKPKPIRPDVLEKLGSNALAKHERRGTFVPDIRLSDDGRWASPYNGKLDGHWWHLFFEMLGTRQAAFVDVFFSHLSEIIPRLWDAEKRRHVPNVPAIRAALAQVQGMNVENEAQAAYAAQLVALHLCTMKLAKLGGYNSDPRSVAVMAKATRAYGDGLLNLKRLQGKIKPTRSRQTYKVERHVHNHQHIHVAGGGAENGGQPHAKPTAGLVEASATVPSQDEGGRAVSISSGERSTCLPNARGQGKRSAEG